ncbi:MAG: dephospho-CoA kinase [Clostridia bacterium]|nr:dephospho-CoA kinase [Clostridia bacterium]
MITIGITGGSGSGKSYVSAKMTEMGGKWIDADKLYHELLGKNHAMRNKILEAFPEARDGEHINRGKLASMVFTNDKDLMKLNSITHPFVIEAIENEIAECYCVNDEFVIIDAIALFESGLSNICDVTIGVIADENLRIDRIVERDDLSVPRARTRVRAQQKEDYYRRKCDYIIENNGETDVDGQIRNIISKVL